MKLLIYTDPHWSQYGSIVRSKGDKYSSRLENLIKSVSWAEGLSKTHAVDAVICAGDFFDTPYINSEEATALQDVKWNLGVPHYFLVGNHEITTASLVYSSTKVLEAFGSPQAPFHIIADTAYVDAQGTLGLVLLPYVLEDTRKPLTEYIKVSPKAKNIIISHNDIKGINYGKYVSQHGFDISEIEENSVLYINGHLHNSGFVNKRETILNLGNLTGLNFSEDATKHAYYACILDTETGELSFLENPYAFNFYKLEINTSADINKLNNLKTNAVLSLKVEESLVATVKEHLTGLSNIVESRLMVFRNSVGETSEVQADLSHSGMDYLNKFAEFMIAKEGDSTIMQYELGEIVKGVA